jgi:hypothetical protein
MIKLNMNSKILKKSWLGGCLLFSLYLCACNTEPNIDIPDEISSLENLTVIAPDTNPIQSNPPVRTANYGDTEDVMIGALRFFEADHLGRVFIADGSLNVIHVYGPDGSYIAQVGSEGDGPGEFRRINSITFDDNHLHVMDAQALRISLFDLNTFDYVDDMDLPFTPDFSGGYFTSPSSFDLMDDGNYLIHFSMGYASGQADRDEIIREYADRDEPWRSMVRNDQMPETWPAFVEAFQDDEMRVWAGLYTDDPESYTWQAYTIEGELYASFKWPRSKTLKAVSNGVLYSIETDPDTDLRQVAKYHFEP